MLVTFFGDQVLANQIADRLGAVLIAPSGDVPRQHGILHKQHVRSLRTADLHRYGVRRDPDGYLVGPNAGSALSASDVNEMIMTAVATANITRAVIRLPLNSTARMAIAVSDLDSTILGLYRMPDGTVFSADVAASKARNVIWFSSVPGRE